MTRPARRRRVWLVAALIVLAPPVAWLLTTLPPSAASVDDSGWKPSLPGDVIAGTVHVHTDRSDGAGSMDEVAAAAGRAGLQFVVFGDHGNGTRPLELPAYRHGVLCVDGVEISTTGGHYLALDLATAPYPLAGEPRDVVEDVARLGGFGIAAHPTSPKNALAWREWSAPFDGIEWLNGDAEWRDESRRTLARVPFDYLVRPAAAMASLLDRPDLALARWDALLARRRIVGIAAADAHGRIDIGGDAYAGGNVSPVPVPSYEASFRTFAVRVEIDRPLRGNAAEDGPAIVDALRRGRTFSVIDALARPARFEFSAVSGDSTARMGETITPSGPVVLRVRAAMPAGSSIELLRDGSIVRTGSTGELVYESDARSGVFRVEVKVPRAPGTPAIPWIVSNPIYVGPRSGEGEALPARLAARDTRSLYRDGETSGWAVEMDAESRAAVNATPMVGGRELAFRYALRGGPIGGQYAALVYGLEGEGPAAGVAGHDRLMFRARANRAMRLEVQVRQPGGPDGERWQRSIYLDEQPRDIVVFFDDLAPVGRTVRRRPDLSRVQALLFVVDTNHNLPASTGIVWLDDVTLGQP